MKKSILAVAGIAALAGVVVPFAGVNALTAQTDTFTVTIADNCAFTYKTDSEHTAKTTATEKEAVIADGAWDSNEYTGTVLNGKQYDSFATSTFNVVCNNLGGYQVTVGTSGFESATLTGEDSWAYAKDSLPATDASGWTLSSSHTGASKSATPSEIVAKTASAVTSEDFTITYSMKVSSKQQAANDYKATATYTFAEL